MPPYIWMPPYVWMPPIHTQHKESMLCQTKGVSICPHTFGCPLYIHKTKKAYFVRVRGVCMPHAFGCLPYVWLPPYVWMPPVCLDAPYVWIPAVCLDTPHMFGCPLYVWKNPKVWVIQTYGSVQMYGSIQTYSLTNPHAYL